MKQLHLWRLFKIIHLFILNLDISLYILGCWLLHLFTFDD